MKKAQECYDGESKGAEVQKSARKVSERVSMKEISIHRGRGQDLN